jgi:hypothetical protein
MEIYQNKIYYYKIKLKVWKIKNKIQKIKLDYCLNKKGTFKQNWHKNKNR